MRKILTLLVLILVTFVYSASEEKKPADFYWREGDQLMSSGKYSQAVKLYSDALDIEPNNVNVLYKRAEANFFDKKFGFSVRDLSQILRLDEKFTRVKSNSSPLGLFIKRKIIFTARAI